MKKVILTPETEINLNQIESDTPIFAKKNGKLEGMYIKEDKGWILRIGGDFGSQGYSKHRIDCIRESINIGYTPYIED